MNWKFWVKKKPIVAPPPPKPFHAGGATIDRKWISWQGMLDIPEEEAEKRQPFMDLVPFDISKKNAPETKEEIKMLSAAMKQPNYQQPRMYFNPMQDIDYMIITGLMKTTFGGALMESYTKFMVGTGFRCELELVNPTGDKKKDQETLERFLYVKQALEEIDRKIDDNDSGARDVPFIDLVTQAVSAANIYNRGVLKFQYYGKPIEVMGKTYKGIPTAMQYIHPRELGIIEVNEAGQLMRVAETTMLNFIEADDMIYVWNPIVTAVEPNATWYGSSKVLPMVDALRQLRYTLSVAFPSMSKNAWAGLFLLFVKPQGQTEAVKQQEYEQVMSSLPRGDGAALMEDPEDVAVENITFDAKFQELKDVAEFCIKTCIAKLGLPNSMFFDEASSNRSCYSADTLTLTESGWKGYQDIDYTKEKIATLNPETNQIEFHVPDGVYIGEYEGDMIHIKTRNTDIMVTPDHDMWVSRSHDPQFIRWEKIKAGDLEEKAEWVMRSFGEWEGTPVPEQYPLEIVEHKLKYAVKQVHSVPTDLWLEFMGYYLSEGTKSRPEKHGASYFVSVAQNIDSPFTPKMQKCMDAMPFHYYNNNSDGTNRWRFNSKQLVNALKDTGDLHDTKKIPHWIKQLPPDKLSIIFEALIAGDGTINPTGGKVYYTTSYQLAQDVQEIALKMGFNATLKLHYDEEYHYRGKGECDAGYRVFIRNNPTHLRRIRRCDIKRVPYKGMIYCYGVKNHLFVTSRNGCVTVQGNTLLGKIQLAISTVIEPTRQVIARQITQQWYMRNFKIIFKDDQEALDTVRPKFVFNDLHIDQWYDKVAAVNEIDARHALTDKAYGELVGIDDYENKIDPDAETIQGGSSNPMSKSEGGENSKGNSGDKTQMKDQGGPKEV